MDYKSIAPWELLQKKMVWEHLKFIRNKRVLDFGSGTGMTANHFAKGNEVIAIEPDENMLSDRFVEEYYVSKNSKREFLFSMKIFLYLVQIH
ncbi:class I SAM-dependent methyltransferase [Clostridium saccharoperbutylacetonicum]|uniref:class I SAM-dependent methyltransferase n=1 Tax=Clostridium saccharoperbutylacetonicum TaxID=36745 RepID=UPI000983BDFE|nr:class I SAM-dependent methyltransferase [Clostridium saccharoperbutylacetonicum]AQR96643.1 hypothetical protein CLSAP_39670 [Clostridium saccharoperbutylacetonicum]NSB32519.1 cyclopropane fatty-acyl-phospholipid synthase-like methyltransferase [Clostridium saccharoperbutylacetonicum]